MSYSLFADDLPALEPSLPPIAPSESGLCMPELGRLSTLRDALLLLKVPLANSCGLRGLVERQLLSNDVHERVLGRLTADKLGTAQTLRSLSDSSVRKRRTL